MAAPTSMVSPEGTQDGDKQAAPKATKVSAAAAVSEGGPLSWLPPTSSEQSAQLSERLPLRLEFWESSQNKTEFLHF